ncbi:hypothetical protein OIV57_33180, partial [Burkholderia pseudomallei]|nr:hypothetical protein [Burkholderia pseudomallei]
AANQPDSSPAASSSETALPAPRRGRGRPPKAAPAGDGNAPPSIEDANTSATDPRQMRIDDSTQPGADNETPAAEAPATTEPTTAAQPDASDAGVDLY